MWIPPRETSCNLMGEAQLDLEEFILELKRQDRRNQRYRRRLQKFELQD